MPATGAALPRLAVAALATGDIVDWMRLEGHIAEMFDVIAMSGVACPMIVGPQADEIRSTITFEPI